MSLRDYRKYGKAAERLEAAIAAGRVAHAYLIEGDHNADKEGFAVAFAQALLCRQMPGTGCGRCATCRKLADGNYEDFYLVRPEQTGSKTGVQSVKDAQIERLQEKLMSVPSAGDRNIGVISEGDTMTLRAQSRLLKTLEEPVPGTVILILVSNAESLMQTIRSRVVSLRLLTESRAADTEMTALAEEFIDMAARRDYFYKLKNLQTEKIRDRSDANAFLDALETVLERLMRQGGGRLSRTEAARAVRDVEAARQTIRRNEVPSFVIRRLYLRLEGRNRAEEEEW